MYYGALFHWDELVRIIRDFTAISRPRIAGFVSVGHGVNEFYSIVIPPIIPLLVADLGISYAQAGLLLTMFFVMFSIFQLPAGILADRFGKGRLIVAGLAGMSVGIFLASLATSFYLLLVAQAIAGICGSTFHPAGMALISDKEGSTTEGRAMGVFGAGGKAGTMAAPLLVGGIAAVSGWRTALVGAALVGFLITLLIIPLAGQESWLGFLRRSRQTPDGGIVRTLRSNLRSVVERAKIPLSRQIVLLFCIAILISVQSRAIQTFTTAYIVEGTQVSISVGNLAFFALLLGAGLAQPVAGSFADRYDRGVIGGIAAVGTALLVGATVFIVRVGGLVTRPILLAIVFGWLFLIGAMMYTMSPIKNALVSANAGAEYSGGLFGTIQTASAIGSASGPAIFGYIATEYGLLSAYPVVAFVSVLLSLLFLALWWDSRGGIRRAPNRTA